MTLHDLYWLIADCIVPHARPLSKIERDKEEAYQAAKLASYEKQITAINDEHLLGDYVGECTKALDREEGRRQSVDARLTSIIGLCAIAATIVFGSILAQATGTMHVARTWLRWIIGLGAWYLALQLCLAIIAAVRGLERRSYLSHDLFIPEEPNRIAILRSKITESSKILADNHAQNNQKVTQMAVAHRSLKNFLVALLLLGALGTYGAMTIANSDPPNETLRKNRELQDLHRGPQGPKEEPYIMQQQSGKQKI